MWINDLQFGENFPVFEEDWRSSLVCFIVYELFLFYSFSTVITSNVLVFFRLVVVKYPLKAQTLSPKFVLRNGTFCLFVILVISCFMTFLLWLLNFRHGTKQLSTLGLGSKCLAKYFPAFLHNGWTLPFRII